MTRSAHHSPAANLSSIRGPGAASYLNLGSEPRRTVRLRQFTNASVPGAQRSSEFRESPQQYTPGWMPTSSGIQNPSYSRLLVTDLWQTSQISGLQILALRIRRHTPRLLKAAAASRCGHLKCSCSFGSSTATCFRAGSTNSSQFCDTGQFGTSRSREVIATKSDCRGRRHSQVRAGAWKTLGRLPALSAGVRKSSAEDHHDELAGRAEVVFAGSIGRPMGS